MTLAHEDKNPYGTFALNELLPAVFPEQVIQHSYETLYEIKDSLKRSGNILIISTQFRPSREDTEALLKHVGQGGAAFISAQNFWGDFNDTLQFSTTDYLFRDGNIFNQKDTAYIHFVNPELDTAKQFYYRRDNIHNYFNHFDTTRTTVIARNDLGNPVSLHLRWGKGSIFLNSTPLAFTNIYLLAQENHEFVSSSLSHLPVQGIEWTEFYHVGRMEAGTPLRFVLTNEPLSWAYYLTVVTLLVFMVFEMKRKQRIIPILKPLQNTTLEFVSTIGNLYYQNKEHRSIAEKKIVFFMDQVRTRYWLSTTKLDESFIQMLSKKSGHAEETVRALIKTIVNIRQKSQLSAQELMELNKKIEAFNKTR